MTKKSMWEEQKMSRPKFRCLAGLLLALGADVAQA
jgi:hypothetical protein